MSLSPDLSNPLIQLIQKTMITHDLFLTVFLSLIPLSSVSSITINSVSVMRGKNGLTLIIMIIM